MPTEVYEEALSIDIDVLEALPLAPQPACSKALASGCNEQSSLDSSYPFPKLTLTGRRQKLTLRALTLENPYLKVQVAPDLGGRVVRIWDKRTQRDILPYSDSPTMKIGGPRGVFLPIGLVWSSVHGQRRNSLGPVDWTVIEPSGDDAPGGVWLFEIDSPSGIGVHVGISMLPDVAEIQFEMRCVNRRLESVAYAPCFEAFVGDGRTWSSAHAAVFDGDGVGLYWAEQGVPAECLAFEQGALSIYRFERDRELGPMQTDTWGVRLVPFSGLDEVSAAGAGAAMQLVESSIRVQSSAARPGCKVLILTESGETLKAEVDLYPEQIAELDLAGVNKPEAISVSDSEAQELVRWQRGERGSIEQGPAPHLAESPVGDFETTVQDLYEFHSDPRQLLRHAFEPFTRAGAHVAVGIAKAQAGDWIASADSFESALAFEAENPVVWWLKALVERRIASRDDEPELLNAHYLAPLDPLLRAAAFLAQPAHAKEATTLLSAMADNPDAMVEVACLLRLCGLNEELSRWCDECLRHREIPMLRYLIADALLSGSRMEVEAAGHVQTAAKTPINPPYPWRAMEFAVLERLRKRFPDDARIETVASAKLRWKPENDIL